jgi:OOP family OmpA-OmpF porin
MLRRIDRRWTLGVAALTSLGIACAGAPVDAASPYPDPSRVAQGAILGGVTGAAVGAGIDHRDRGRGALIGGLGGVILGAIFAQQIEQHEAWHRAQAAYRDRDRSPYREPHPDPCSGWSGSHADDPHERGCDGRHAWEDDPAYDQRGNGGYEDPHGEHVWEEPAAAEPALGVPEVLFDPGSATLTRGAEARLRYLARQVRERDDVEILLRGHSDERERDGFDLSEARARAVRAFLTEEGVAVRRIAWVGFGDAQPVASNETAAGRQRNRRVEIVLRAPDPGPYS